MLTKEELLKPRYKVIAAYPMCLRKVGTVLDNCGKSLSGNYLYDLGKDTWDSEYLDKYPHLFKRLEWWEERELPQMPEYLKGPDGGVVKPTMYSLGYPFAFYTGEMEKKGKFKGMEEPFNLAAFLPATEEEYNSFRETQYKR